MCQREGEVGRPTGLEPATSGTTNRCSNQLNYDRRMPRLSAHTYRSAQRQGRGPMNRPTTLPNANVTIDKFGFPGTLITEYEHWVVLLRPQAPTLGSLVLAAKSDATAYGALPAAAFHEQARVVAEIEAALAAAVAFEKINYLMLMMVDPNVHFHVIPRYAQPRLHDGVSYADAGWPKLPDLGTARVLSAAEIAAQVKWLRSAWPS